MFKALPGWVSRNSSQLDEKERLCLVQTRTLEESSDCGIFGRVVPAHPFIKNDRAANNWTGLAEIRALIPPTSPKGIAAASVIATIFHLIPGKVSGWIGSIVQMRSAGA
ncbi:hypothetical protein JTE90_029461 [Oedothorax gibbosus]|uniref:Uncharacterized protein n=1 Tax=Oedothorax gibbosus TaxID=931172 RepID=A0AAV6V4P6_9ARAC|nr:hypothetical protein JTE90_029461 [Oedothorax gibbosus]